MFTCFQHWKCFNTTGTQRISKRREAALTVDGDAGLRFVILAGNLPDVEGLGGRFGQQAEHEDDGVSVRKAVRVDVSAQRETEAIILHPAVRKVQLQRRRRRKLKLIMLDTLQLWLRGFYWVGYY